MERAIVIGAVVISVAELLFLGWLVATVRTLDEPVRPGIGVLV